MANTTLDNSGNTRVIRGEFATVFLCMSLDEYHGALYTVYDDDDEVLFQSGNGDEAAEWAENYADNGPGPDDEPSEGYLSDAMADADALASIGWGTDEDYGDGGFDE